MKRIVQRHLLFLLVVWLPITAWSQGQDEGKTIYRGIEYTWEDDHWVVTGYDQNSISGLKGNMTIHSSINTENKSGSVKKILSNAFAGIQNAKKLIIDSSNLETIEDGAFNGLGNQGEPVRLEINPLNLLSQLNNTEENGVFNLYGGYFEYIFHDYLSDIDVPAFRLEYKLMKVIPQNGEETISGECFLMKVIKGDGREDYTLSSENNTLSIDYAVYHGGFLKIVGIADNALEGIGSDEAPVPLNTNIPFLKKFDPTFSDGVTTLKGGKFKINKKYHDDGIVVTYSYNEVNNIGEYIVTNAEKESEYESDYRLHIWSEIEEDDEETQLHTPVTAIRAGAISDEAKNVIKSVLIHSTYLMTVEPKAFSGLGTAEAPLPLLAESPVAIATALKATFTDGVASIGGGFFTIGKRMGIVNYLLDGNEFIAASYDQTLVDNIIAQNKPVELEVLDNLGERDDNGQWQYYNVTKIKAGAFDGIQGVSKINIEGNNLQSIGENAFRGVGTDAQPINLDMNVNKFKNYGGTFDKYKAILAGGIFVLAKTSDEYGIRVTYTYSEDAEGEGGYVVTKAEVIPDFGGPDFRDYRLNIRGQFYEWEKGTIISSVPITSIEAGAISGEAKNLIKSVHIYGSNLKNIGENEFAGIGTSESLVSLIIEQDVLTALQGKLENGIIVLAGGYFRSNMIAEIATHPAAIDNLEYTGEPQALLVPGVAENGTMIYQIENGEPSGNIPTATNANTYNIFYYAKGVNGYLDSELQQIEVTIAPDVVEEDGGTKVEQLAPTLYSVIIDETNGSKPIDNNLLDEEGSITAYNFDYKRTLTQGEDPYTVCLPTPPPTEGLTYYTLKGLSGSNTLVFEAVSSPQANTPYLVVANSNSNLESTQEGNSVKLKKDCGNNQTINEGYTLKGTLTGLSNADAVAEGAYILQSGNVWKKVVSGTVCIPACRAYIVATGAAQARLFSDIDGTTSIDTIRTIDQDGIERWYNLNGQRISQPAQNGVFINNGKKVIKK